MEYLTDPVSLPPCVVVLGMFDGVHLGHQALLRAGRAMADRLGVPMCVCTFEPHPLEVLRPELAPPRLTLPDERAALMEQYGTDILCIRSFTPEFAGQMPEDFLKSLEGSCPVRGIVCGFNYSFGKRGIGKPEDIIVRGKTMGYETAVVPCVELDGDTVSSTRIRKMLSEGNIAEAERLLGHAYRMHGTVAHGKELGRTIGFPTANIVMDSKKAQPGDGVYAGEVIWQGRSYPAIVNFGNHPTAPGGGHTVEAHLPGVKLDLYGEPVELRLWKYLRSERKFGSLEELQGQLKRDCEALKDDEYAIPDPKVSKGRPESPLIGPQAEILY